MKQLTLLLVFGILGCSETRPPPAGSFDGGGREVGAAEGGAGSEASSREASSIDVLGVDVVAFDVPGDIVLADVRVDSARTDATSDAPADVRSDSPDVASITDVRQDVFVSTGNACDDNGGMCVVDPPDCPSQWFNSAFESDCRGALTLCCMPSPECVTDSGGGNPEWRFRNETICEIGCQLVEPRCEIGPEGEGWYADVTAAGCQSSGLIVLAPCGAF